MTAAHYLALGALSSCSLALEIVLMRLFSLMQGHHFASMVISLALLGIGAGGVGVRLLRSRLLPAALPALSILCSLFGVCIPISFLAAKLLCFNPLEVMWGGQQWAALLGTYTVLAAPFFCFGAVMSLAMAWAPERIKAIYAADLLGAGLGALLAPLALGVFLPGDCLRVLASGGLLASGLLALGHSRGKKPAAALLLAAALLPVLLPQSVTRPALSEYKGLARAGLRPGAETVQERPSLHGTVSLVASPEIPFRFAPGLSPLCRTEPPEQLLVYLNGEQYGALPAPGIETLSPSFVTCLPSQAAYELLSEPRVLVSGGASGLGLFEVLGRRTDDVDALFKNGVLRDLAAAGSLDRHEGNGGRRVRAFTGTLRAFLAGTQAKYDLLHLWTPCSGGGGIGAQGLSEGFTCTLQGMDAMLAALRPGGMVQLSRWLEHPPAGTLKLLATARQALERSGRSSPARCLALIASPTTATLLVKPEPFTQVQAERIECFCRERAFRPVVLPGKRPEPGPDGDGGLQRTAAALLDRGAQAFQESYPFSIRPATDGSPYFSCFFRWSALPRLVEHFGSAGKGLIQWGYLVLVALVVQAVAVGGLLILLPLAIFQRGKESWKRSGRAGAAFTCLGLAFLMVEIACLQRLMLLLGDPVTAVSTTLASFLIFAGLGSLVCRRVGLGRAVACICLLNLLLVPGLLLQVQSLMALPAALRLLVSAAGCALPAFFMGMPLPLGLERVSRQAPQWIPWAWGVNGCASVLGPVLATLLALHFGFAALMATACLLYLGAWLAFRSMDREAARVHPEQYPDLP